MSPPLGVLVFIGLGGNKDVIPSGDSGYWLLLRFGGIVLALFARLPLGSVYLYTAGCAVVDTRLFLTTKSMEPPAGVESLLKRTNAVEG